MLALDAGGSTTRALLADGSGHALGHGRAGSGNPTSGGPDRALASLGAAAAQALAQAGAQPSAVSRVVVAMAGEGGLLSDEALAGALRFTGPARGLRRAPDILAMYHSGTAERDGCAVLAGTGSIAARVVAGQVVQVAGGNGWLVGDDGSGFWIGHRVARAAVADLDGTGPPTALTALVLDQLGAARGHGRDRGRPATLTALVRAVYADPPVALAALAPLAFAAATADAVAAAIVGRAQQELAVLVRAVRNPGDRAPVVAGGSVLVHGVLPLGAAMAPALGDALAGAELRTAADGVAGAALIGLFDLGGPVGPDTLDRLLAGIPALTGS